MRRAFLLLILVAWSDCAWAGDDGTLGDQIKGIQRKIATANAAHDDLAKEDTALKKSEKANDDAVADYYKKDAAWHTEVDAWRMRNAAHEAENCHEGDSCVPTYLQEIKQLKNGRDSLNARRRDLNAQRDANSKATLNLAEGRKDLNHRTTDNDEQRKTLQDQLALLRKRYDDCRKSIREDSPERMHDVCGAPFDGNQP